ncbi:MAG: RidA family protein [Bacteroidia bacterium]|jgi:2-iminobutanoate/2-iminopropanoate deaminase|nr:MAG: RidA family protein [Bacteroidia bacterium]
MKKNEPNSRRKALKGVLAAMAVGLGATSAKAATPKADRPKKIASNITKSQDVPLFSGGVAYGNLLFIAGKGAHFEGDITAHTDHVLKELEKELVKNGSSMDKVLKVNVYLADLADYNAMNKVYRGRFGENPPVRTTVATYGGVPGNSLVEIDCIAALD